MQWKDYSVKETDIFGIRKETSGGNTEHNGHH